MDCNDIESLTLSAELENSLDKHSTLRHALMLGSITALGALGIDAYLPAFPSIAHSLGVNVGRVQLSLVSYFVALAMGQLVYGPLSDRYGRRTPLMVGLQGALSVGCSTAPFSLLWRLWRDARSWGVFCLA